MNQQKSKKEEIERKNKIQSWVVGGIITAVVLGTCGTAIAINFKNAPQSTQSTTTTTEEYTTTTSDTMNIDSSTEATNGLDVDFDDLKFFSTNAVTDDSVFIPTEPKPEVKTGTLYWIPWGEQYETFLQESGLNFYREELVKFSQLDYGIFGQKELLVYIDEYEENSYNRVAKKIELQDSKTVELYFEKDLESKENTGGGYWVYAVWIDKKALNDVDPSAYPLKIEMVDNVE